jgi:Lectin C-type domain.
MVLPFLAPLNGHAYYISDNGGDYATGLQLCNDLGGHLGTITSQEEQDFVLNLLQNYNSGNNHLWLGLNDLNGDGGFDWVTSEPFDYENWASVAEAGEAVEFTNSGEWHSTDPNDDQDYRRYLLEIEETLLDSVGSDELTTYSITGLNNYTEYAYKISAVDTAGNESDLSIQITGIPREGSNEGSVSFDGSYDYINCGNDESLNIQDNLTVQGWAYYDGGGSQHPRFFGKRFDGTAAWNIGLYDGQNIYYETHCVSGNCPGTNTGIPFPQDGWHHIAWTFSGTTGEVMSI